MLPTTANNGYWKQQMWRFACDVENDEYKRGILPEHVFSNTTGKRRVESRSCYSKVNMQNCGNDWRYGARHF